MDMVSVDSSNIESVGHDEDSSTLQVEFKNGGTYQYFDVTEEEFIGLRDADSPGKYFASRIKGTYRYSKV